MPKILKLNDVQIEMLQHALTEMENTSSAYTQNLMEEHILDFYDLRDQVEDAYSQPDEEEL